MSDRVKIPWGGNKRTIKTDKQPKEDDEDESGDKTTPSKGNNTKKSN